MHVQKGGRFMRQLILISLFSVFIFAAATPAQAQDKQQPWLPSLITETPQQGFELAVKLARKGVTSTQSNKEVLFRERDKYSNDAEHLMMASQVIALHYQTIAAANNYWR